MKPFRLLIASVKKGHYPCLQCLIPVWKFQDMGLLCDKKCHGKLGRKGDAITRHTIVDARNTIYQGWYMVDGEKINKILKDQSLAPVAVGVGA